MASQKDELLAMYANLSSAPVVPSAVIQFLKSTPEDINVSPAVASAFADMPVNVRLRTLLTLARDTVLEYGAQICREARSALDEQARAHLQQWLARRKGKWDSFVSHVRIEHVEMDASMGHVRRSTLGGGGGHKIVSKDADGDAHAGNTYDEEDEEDEWEVLGFEASYNASIGFVDIIDVRAPRGCSVDNSSLAWVVLGLAAREAYENADSDAESIGYCSTGCMEDCEEWPPCSRRRHFMLYNEGYPLYKYSLVDIDAGF